MFFQPQTNQNENWLESRICNLSYLDPEEEEDEGLLGSLLDGAGDETVPLAAVDRLELLRSCLFSLEHIPR